MNFTRQTWRQPCAVLLSLLLCGCLGSGDDASPSATTTSPTNTSAQANYKVVVTGVGGVQLPDALVSVDSATAVRADASGVAAVSTAADASELLVRVSRPGYITQVVRVPQNAVQNTDGAQVILQPVKQEMVIPQIENAAVYRADTLGASVSLPANALVVAATGQPATGPARLQITPWNIRSDELSAMPGNGRAINEDGAEGVLISAGMMTVDFFDAQGAKLQLASGKTAVIQMDMLLSHLDNEPLTDGSTIPLWYFNEEQGLWRREGNSTVVTDLGSPTGLALQARVGHFSTWNGDGFAPGFDIDEYLKEQEQNAQTGSSGSSGSSGSTGSATTRGTNVINIQCRRTNGIDAVPCSLVSRLTLADGSTLVGTAPVGAQGIQFSGLPSQGTITWTAVAIDGSGARGTLTTGTSGTYQITLGTVTTAHNVRCVLPNGQGTPCDVTMSLVDADGETVQTAVSLSAGGGRLQTGYETEGPLTWTAQSSTWLDASGQYVRYVGGNYSRFTGTATSGLTGDVVIELTQETPVVSKTVYLACDPNLLDAGDTPATISECRLTALFLNVGGNDAETREGFSVTASVGARVPVPITPDLAGATLSVSGSAFTADGRMAVSTVGSYWFIDALADGIVQLIRFTLNIDQLV